MLFRLRQHLPQELDSQIKKVESQVKFRFGNKQSLTSAYRVQIPLLRADQQARKLWLSVEVVPGETPFLFSKRAFKQLGGILDTTKDKCFLSRLSRVFPLELSKTDLYLIDVSKLCSPPQSDDEIFVATHDGNINVSWGKVDTRDGVHESSQPKTEGRDAVPKFPRFVSDPTRIFPKPRVSSFHSATPVLIPSRDRQDARQCHVDESQECLGVHHRSPHVTPAGSCSSTGDRGRERPGPIDEQFRAEPDHDQHAAGITEPTYGSSGIGGCSNTVEFQPSDKEPSRSSLDNHGSDKSWQRPSVNSHGESGDASLTECTIQPEQQSCWNNNFGLDPSRGGRGVSDRDRASRSSRIDRHDEDAHSVIPTNRDYVHDGPAKNHRHLGSDPNCFGEKAQGQDVPRSLSERHRLLSLVSGPIQQPSRESARLREVLSSPCRDGQPQSEPLKKVSFEAFPVKSFQKLRKFPEFYQEMKAFRKSLDDAPKPSLFDSTVSQAFQKAEETLEQVCQSSVHSCARDHVMLLEVYAGTHSPLAEAVKQLGHKAIRFSREDGDLISISEWT